jgi:hypothetical protein
MTREIELLYPTESAVLRVELLDDAAPKTSQAVWDALPLEGPAGHGNILTHRSSSKRRTRRSTSKRAT